MTDHPQAMASETSAETADRGMPAIANRAPSGGVAQKIVFVLVVLVTLLALVAVNGGFSRGDVEREPVSPSPATTPIGNRLGPAPALPAPPPPPNSPKPVEKDRSLIRTGQVTVPPPPPRYVTQRVTATAHPGQPKAVTNTMTPEDRKRTAGLLAFDSSASDSATQGLSQEQAAAMATGRRILGSGVFTDAQDDRADGLSARLQPTTLDGARASVMVDRDLFLTRGAFLECALETAISSDVPGMTRCRLTRDVYSTSGKVLLLERGSRMTGQYQGGLRRGQARIFVLWDRIETPTGVIVNLDSPGTDALGRAGHSGHIDTHFWERFGGAILLSLVDDAGTWLANQGQSGDGNNTVQFSATSSAAQDAVSIDLEQSINIPPTLIKNQGEHITIFVARDLDFRGVYELKLH